MILKTEFSMEMNTSNFEKTIDSWINSLENYSYQELSVKPGPQSWSLLQVIMHLIRENKFYEIQIEECLNNNENIGEEMKKEAKAMFENNAFPDQRLKGYDSGENLPLPANKEALEQQLLEMKNEMNLLWIKINNKAGNGKTGHPGLGYFNAKEWFQFAEMHLRHHLRQKARIDEFLRVNLQKDQLI